MEQKVIVKNENICIYFMKESNLGFYLLIPNARHLKITLALFENTDENFIKNIKINPDKAIVIPVIQADILKQANQIGSSSYNYLNQVLSFLINTSYKILSYNHIEVDNQILLNNSKKLENFEQNFNNSSNINSNNFNSNLMDNEKKSQFISSESKNEINESNVSDYVSTSNEQSVYQPTMQDKKKKGISFNVTRELKVTLFIVFILLLFVLVIPYIYDFFRELLLGISTR